MAKEKISTKVLKTVIGFFIWALPISLITSLIIFRDVIPWPTGE